MGVKGSLRIRDRDKGFKRLQRLLNSQGLGKGPHVLVGILQGTTGRSGGAIDNVGIGTAHEFGLNVPERSFIRATIDKQQGEHRRLVRRLADRVVTGKITQRQALEGFGLKVVSDIKATIVAKIPPKLTDETLFRKRTAGNPKQTPLIDTGQLINSISHKVVM